MNEENLARVEWFVQELGKFARELGRLQDEMIDLHHHMAFAIGASEAEEKKAA